METFPIHDSGDARDATSPRMLYQSHTAVGARKRWNHALWLVCPHTPVETRVGEKEPGNVPTRVNSPVMLVHAPHVPIWVPPKCAFVASTNTPDDVSTLTMRMAGVAEKSAAI